MPAFIAEVGMPYWTDLTTSNPQAAAEFYSQLLGWEISGDDYRIARLQGLPVAGLIPQPEGTNAPDTWVTYFLSADIAGDIAKVQKLGGSVLADPREVELGTMTVLADAAGGLFGLLQPKGEDKFIAAGEPSTPVWHELTCNAGFEDAVEFYHELFDWGIRTLTDDEADADGVYPNGTYAAAMADGAPFAGLWKAEGQFPPQVKGFWQTYLGVSDADEAARRCAELGGEVIREPWDSPFGRLCLIADPTGATVILCEVEEAPEEGREEDPLDGIDLP